MKIKQESHLDIGAYLTLKVIFHQRFNFDLKEQLKIVKSKEKKNALPFT